MNRVAIVSAVRTPMTKSGTSLADIYVTDLAKTVMVEALYRANLKAEDIDEVILGNVIMPPDATNPARIAALKAGFPYSTPAYTVQRNCASGMEAITQAALRIRSGDANILLAGGAESMSNAPLLFPQETLKPMGNLAKAKGMTSKFVAMMKLRPKHFKPISSLLVGLTDPTVNLIMGKTAEILAKEFNISREDQDTFANESHKKAILAIEKEIFKERIVNVYVGKRNHPAILDVGPRSGQSIHALNKLKPIFDRKDGSVTVGNSCQITDGAAMLVLMNEELAKSKNIPILGYISSWAATGCDPSRMGLGPVSATKKVLEKTSLTLNDMDLVEINEAFSAQVLACLKLFVKEDMLDQNSMADLYKNKLNVNGGAIALGHPVGMTGARIVMDIAYELKNRNLNRGLATLCVGGGQGQAVIVERE